MHSPVDRLAPRFVDHHKHLVPGNFLSALVTKSALFPQIPSALMHKVQGVARDSNGQWCAPYVMRTIMGPS